jgi:2-polyprenyl-3-methyl-5-hydroxy-6-metoxy-1,4-benzoquinol methylase
MTLEPLGADSAQAKLAHEIYTTSIDGNALPWTGERFIPGHGGQALALEHLHRYELAQGLCHGLTVLDLGCGEGYGSSGLIASGAESVVSVDLAHEAVFNTLHAHTNTPSGGVVTDAMALPFRSGAFDVVVRGAPLNCTRGVGCGCGGDAGRARAVLWGGVAAFE